MTRLASASETRVAEVGGQDEEVRSSGTEPSTLFRRASGAYRLRANRAALNKVIKNLARPRSDSKLELVTDFSTGECKIVDNMSMLLLSPWHPLLVSPESHQNHDAHPYPRTVSDLGVLHNPIHRVLAQRSSLKMAQSSLLVLLSQMLRTSLRPCFASSLNPWYEAS
ncbi:hypothetical protein EV356DRAFT_233290 [Viridothelium virens]|uniref:Uncharacterized protein n=1 Tax=Viridothelium virens TaxID=1048519 RepID=A0A6A6H4T4_VIRVR|nr:hypothetical protein EV356DRAFT_233290 [Viridothelium virens]